jgi:hypothetical protein
MGKTETPQALTSLLNNLQVVVSDSLPMGVVFMTGNQSVVVARNIYEKLLNEPIELLKKKTRYDIAKEGL